MTESNCTLCPRPTRQLHHITGRGFDHQQFDPDLVVALCLYCHTQVHADLRTNRVDTPLATQSPLLSVERRIRRIGNFIGLVASSHPALLWCTPLARSLIDCANQISDCVENLVKSPTRKGMNK